MNLFNTALLATLLTFSTFLQRATCAFPHWNDNANDASSSDDDNPYSLVITYHQDGALRQRTLRLTMRESDNEDVLKVNHVFQQTISVVAAQIVKGPRGVACLFMYRPITITTPEESGNVSTADMYTGEEYEDEDEGNDDDRSGDVGRMRPNAPTRAEILPFDYVSRWAAQDFNEVYCTAPAYQDLLQ